MRRFEQKFFYMRGATLASCKAAAFSLAATNSTVIVSQTVRDMVWEQCLCDSVLSGLDWNLFPPKKIF